MILYSLLFSLVGASMSHSIPMFLYHASLFPPTNYTCSLKLLCPSFQIFPHIIYFLSEFFLLYIFSFFFHLFVNSIFFLSLHSLAYAALFFPLLSYFLLPYLVLSCRVCLLLPCFFVFPAVPPLPFLFLCFLPLFNLAFSCHILLLFSCHSFSCLAVT